MLLIDHQWASLLFLSLSFLSSFLFFTENKSKFKKFLNMTSLKEINVLYLEE